MQLYKKIIHLPHFIKYKLNYLNNNNYFIIQKKCFYCSKLLKLKNVRKVNDENTTEQNDVYYILKNNELPVCKEKNRIELILLNTIKTNKLDNVVKEILSIINENPKNRDIYINKNLMLAFYIILIKRKYYVNNLKNSIYDNCSLNIFDFIHYNINLHLKNYNLKNICEVLNNLSKYIYKNKSNNISNELVKNIFYFSFFSNFNKFYPKKNYNKLNDEKNINKQIIDNKINEKKCDKEECNLHIYNSYKLKNSNQTNLIERNIIKEQNYLIKENTSNSEISIKKEDSKDLLNNNELKKITNTNYKYKDFNEETFAYLNSFIIFLSNHPNFISEKILYNISLLGSKIIEFKINFRISLSFLSASLNIFDKQKTNKRNLFIYKKTNFDILYNILKECNEIINKNNIENKESNELMNNYNKSNKENSEFDNDSSKQNFNSQKKKYKKYNTKNHINLWNYSHIINVIKIMKIQNFLSRNYTNGEKCLEEFFINFINYASIYQNDSIIISQNELNNFISIYVNLSVLLSELKSYKNTFLKIMDFLNNSYKCIYVQYNNLHINMMINLLRGIYHQLLIISGINSYQVYFKKIEKNVLYKSEKSSELLNIKEKQIINLIMLIQNISNCIMYTDKKKNDLNLGKLITLVHYMHKINKIFITFKINDLFKTTILNFITKSENMFYYKKYSENSSNHHILLFLNIYLYYKGLNRRFLNNCFNYLNANDSYIFKNETEIIMFINFVMKFNKIKEKIKTEYQEIIYDIKNVFNNNNNDKKELRNNEKNTNVDNFLFFKDNVKSNENISYNDKSNENLSYNDKSNKNLSYNDKSNKILSYNDKSNENLSYNDKSNENISYNDKSNENISYNDKSNKNLSYNDKSNENISYNDKSNKNLSYNDKSNKNLSYNDKSNKILSYNDKSNENLSYNDIDISIKNYIDKIMNILYNPNKNKSTEFLSIQHNSFLCKENTNLKFEKSIMKIYNNNNNNNSSSNMNNTNPFTHYSLNTFFLVYENIYSFYENSKSIQERLLNSLNELLNQKKNKLSEENFFFILSAFLKTKNLNHDIFYSYYEFMKKKLQSIEMKYLFFIIKRIIEESHNLINNNENKIPSNCIKNNLIFTNIINLSINIILNDKNFMNNFTFIKEILHIYFQKYKNCFLFYKEFNYFILSYLDNFIRCDNLDENHLVMIINNISSFYYTISKYSDQTKKMSLIIEPKKNKKLIHEDINLDKIDIQKKKKNENIYCIRYRKNQDSLNNNINNKHNEINKKNVEKIELFKNDFYNYVKENYNEQCLKNELIKQLNTFLYTLYNNKLKNKINKEIKLTNMNIIDIFVSLKNSKLREVNIMYILCKKYIMNIFAVNNVKIEYQIKFFNSIIFLDYLKEADIIFKYIILKNRDKWNHIFYMHFLKLPINVFYIPNISTYILNFFCFLEYLNKKDKERILKKAKFFIQMLLKIYSYNDMNSLDKRNIFLLFVLLSFPNSPINISSLSFKSLKLFYIHFIKKDLLCETNTVYSSSIHQNISEFVISFIRKNTKQYDVFNEKQIHTFNIDIVLNKK
ncbi:conserved Plasmodium protein, unknown function [Plasmodium gallinaceum]|uniref:Uncharacterized protein n=1 Tax=Plasmodium gallinaceum TaxID=5849 RepID=A0A1J1GSY6_PLAGA|nr:conserved Plasmodium protein, unknown function [Plasmodium gallinaceum]CRG95398.1 conserved Plasmodium protein, unknown function [Plasmodium gallinaceum]